MPPTFTALKDPRAKLDYVFDWSRWLDSGDSISSASFTAASGLSISSTSVASPNATIRLAGGTAGSKYTVTCQITTANGLDDERSAQIAVNDR